jgi:ABC-type Fe3+ transport system substrate-binding protein
MTDSFAAELRDLIDRAFVAEHGGRATVQMVHNSVHRDLPEHLVDYLIGKGLQSRIRTYFNDKDAAGLPKRPAVNSDGIHADAGLLTLAECGYVYDGYKDRAAANEQQAEKWRERVLEQHGVDLAERAVAS